MDANSPTPPRIALVTGRIRAGKSTAVLRIVEAAERQDLRIRGVLAVPGEAEKVKSRILLRDLATGDTELLARREQKGWAFQPSAFTWANERMQRGIAEDPDLFVLDEVGPVEILAEGGHAEILAPLGAGRLARAVVVVREGLIDPLKQLLPNPELEVFAVTERTRDSVPGAVLGWLGL